MPGNLNAPLYPGQNTSAWHLKTTEEISALAAAGSIPILSVPTFCRRGDDEALDVEEYLLGSFLQEIRDEAYLILPPFRFCPKQDPRQVFAVDAVTAWEMLSDILTCIHASGFKKCVLFHAQPLLADWLDCGLRDHRLETGMGLFRMNLASLGLDIEDASIRASFNKDHPLYKAGATKFAMLLKHIATQPLPPPLRSSET